jgi:hypothetical protein
MALSHSAAFRKQASFNHDSKIKVGKNVWRKEQSGHRLYAEVLSKNPATVTEAFTLASELKQPFSPGQVMGHLKWLYTAGELEVDGKSYQVQAKPKVEAKPEAAKAEPPKVKKPKVKAMAARKSVHVQTKKAA